MRIFTDPHIARSAGAHTTHASSKLLDTLILTNALKAATTDEQEPVICVGDLFDKSNNKELGVLQGLQVAAKCDLILAGNHDLANREGTKTSIEIVEEVHKNLSRAEVSEVLVDYYDDDGVEFTVIPHHSSQDLFDQAIEKACNEAKVIKDIVFLHCNFDNPFAQNDASLNLSVEQAEALLVGHKYIVMGHEHNHRWEMQGRLLICGNTHPTSFSDIGDKFYWNYTSDDGFTNERIWSKEDSYFRVPLQELLEFCVSELLDDSDLANLNFIEVYGEDVDPELAPDVTHTLQSIWTESAEKFPNLVMVRNNITYKQLETEVVDETLQLEDVTKAITKDLEGSDLQELWITHLGAATND